MSASSASFTAGWSRGRSLNHHRKNTPQTMPSRPKSSKARRHETCCSRRATRNGVTAPPQRAANHMRPCARSRSWPGSQFAHHLRQVREAAGLAHAEQEAAREQRRVVPDPAGRRGEERPQRHHAQEDDLRAPAVAHPAARDLERRVGPGEDEEDPAHLDAAQGEVGLDVRRGLGDHDPVRVRDEGEAHREDDDPVPCVRGALHGIGTEGDSSVGPARAPASSLRPELARGPAGLGRVPRRRKGGHREGDRGADHRVPRPGDSPREREVDPPLRPEPQREHRRGRDRDGEQHVRPAPRAAPEEAEEERPEEAPRRHAREAEGDLDGGLALPEAAEADRERGENERPHEGQEPAEPEPARARRARCFPKSGATMSWARAEASELRAEDSEHIAAEKMPATR